MSGKSHSHLTVDHIQNTYFLKKCLEGYIQVLVSPLYNTFTSIKFIDINEPQSYFWSWNYSLLKFWQCPVKHIINQVFPLNTKESYLFTICTMAIGIDKTSNVIFFKYLETIRIYFLFKFFFKNLTWICQDLFFILFFYSGIYLESVRNLSWKWI